MPISARGYIEATNVAITGTVSSRFLEGTIYALDRTLSVTATTGTMAVHFDNSTLEALTALTDVVTSQLQPALVNSINNTFTPILNADLLTARGWSFP